jgi:integrase
MALRPCLGRRQPGPPGHEPHAGQRHHQHPYQASAQTDPDRSVHQLQAQQWAAGIAGSLETVRKVVTVLSGAPKPAVDDGRLPANPAQRLKPPKRIKTTKRYLSHDEVAALALAVGRRPHGHELGYDRLILLMAYCGLCWGELSGLRVQDLDLPRARLQVKSVQRMLGHASAAMTLDTYSDLFDDDLDNVASALNEIALKSDVQLLMT